MAIKKHAQRHQRGRVHAVLSEGVEVWGRRVHARVPGVRRRRAHRLLVLWARVGVARRPTSAALRRFMGRRTRHARGGLSSGSRRLGLARLHARSVGRLFCCRRLAVGTIVAQHTARRAVRGVVVARLAAPAAPARPPLVWPACGDSVDICDAAGSARSGCTARAERPAATSAAAAAATAARFTRTSASAMRTDCPCTNVATAAASSRAAAASRVPCRSASARTSESRGVSSTGGNSSSSRSDCRMCVRGAASICSCAAAAVADATSGCAASATAVAATRRRRSAFHPPALAPRDTMPCAATGAHVSGRARPSRTPCCASARLRTVPPCRAHRQSGQRFYRLGSPRGPRTRGGHRSRRRLHSTTRFACDGSAALTRLTRCGPSLV